MLFNSFSFAIFFPAVVVAYFSVPKKYQTFLLLAASCYFYMAFVPAYVLILFFLITVDYFSGQAIEKRTGAERKKFLWFSVAANLGILFFFKYFNFFNINLAALASFLGWNYSPTLLNILLPIGLSFHVFQSLSYVIEVYRGHYQAEKNYLTYALYVMFFPQLVAGPIERPQNLLPQLHLSHEFDAVRARRGIERMLWGFVKKLVIADQIAVLIDPVFRNIPNDGLVLLFVVFLFSYQLYCDFSGYSDIAIGAALVLGFDLTENFDRPYASRSVSEFWRRWHMSLSNWLRDYLYYPLALGWGKVSKIRLYASTFITFVLIGLWHGANWTFVVMGAMHGAYLVIGSATAKVRRRFAEMIGLNKVPKLQQAVQTATVFCLVSASFVFFRAESVSQAWTVLSRLGSNIFDIGAFRGLGFGGVRHAAVYAMIGVMETVQYFQARRKTFYIFDDKPRSVRYAWYYILLFAILVYGYFGETAFIYFKF